MKLVKNLFAQLVREDDGVTMLEYALIAALVAVASILAWTGLGTGINTKIGEVNTKLGTAGN